MAQVPPPPQADGRNKFLSDRVDKSELPGFTTNGLPSSPLTMIFTSPCGTSLDWARISPKVSSRMTAVNAIAEKTTNVMSKRKTIAIMISNECGAKKDAGPLAVHPLSFDIHH
jgi:hypothetical protein